MNSEQIAVYLGLGSSMGDRGANLTRAIEYLSQRLKLVEKSSIYDTMPEGNEKQPRFLNMVCKVMTHLKPPELLTLTQGIERKMGRHPGHMNAPRPMDIDILFYGDQVIKEEGLIVPYARLQERAFVLVPLAEIAPGLKHPVLNKSAKQLLQELGRVHGVVKWQPDKEQECTGLQ